MYIYDIIGIVCLHLFFILHCSFKSSIFSYEINGIGIFIRKDPYKTVRIITKDNEITEYYDDLFNL